MSRLRPQSVPYQIDNKSQWGLFYSIIYGGSVPNPFPPSVLRTLHHIRDAFVTHYGWSRLELEQHSLEDLAYLSTPGPTATVQLKGPKEFVLTRWSPEETRIFLKGAAILPRSDAFRRKAYLEGIVETQGQEIHQMTLYYDLELTSEEKELLLKTFEQLGIPIPMERSRKVNVSRERGLAIMQLVKAALQQ